MENKIIHGPHVRQKTYQKAKARVAFLEGQLGLSGLAERNLKIALDGYYFQHNQHCRCECGMCDHARRLCNYPYKPNLKEIEDAQRTLPIFKWEWRQ